MTGDIVNLRQFRKNKNRSEKQNKAAENGAKFGRTKAQKRLEETQKDGQAHKLDGHKRRPQGDVSGRPENNE